jgi:farnesyl diphosphate synthase
MFEPTSKDHVVLQAQDWVSDKSLRRDKFHDMYKVVRQELLDHFEGLGMPAEAIEWYRRVSIPLRACDMAFILIPL